MYGGQGPPSGQKIPPWQQPQQSPGQPGQPGQQQGYPQQIPSSTALGQTSTSGIITFETLYLVSCEIKSVLGLVLSLAKILSMRLLKYFLQTLSP